MLRLTTFWQFQHFRCFGAFGVFLAPISEKKFCSLGGFWEIKKRTSETFFVKKIAQEKKLKVEKVSWAKFLNFLSSQELTFTLRLAQVIKYF